MTELFIDTKEMKKLAVELRAVSVESEKAFYAGLVAAGELVAERARKNARSIPRKGPGTARIADSIVVRRRAANVRISAGGESAPEAAPLEHHGLPGKFRHPVPNTGKWVDQQAHPFLVPAALEEEPEVFAVINGLVDGAFRSLGF